ncbi:MAG: thiopurine S-methyltransferase [Gammaproteobacteria bacterium]|nr:thiopurine S-methyltransferase [Gammaproteobacteria bacterium]
MEKEFWQDKWQADDIAFHQDQAHPFLEKHLSEFKAGEKARVFVPLCGKSNDMLFWAKHRYEVIGLELSPIAAEAFYSENGISFKQSVTEGFQLFSASQIQILCGDYFSVSARHIGSVSTVFDRAALIALPPVMRRDYADKMRSLLAAGTEIFLIALEYEQDLVKAPPFSISDEEILELYNSWCNIRLMEKAEAQVKGKPCFERFYRMEVR